MESQNGVMVDTSLIETEVKQKIGDTITVAKKLAAAIKDDAGRTEAAKFGGTIQSKISMVKEKREEIVVPLRKSYERVRDFFDDALKPLESSKKALSQAVSAYDVEQERKHRLAEEARQAEIKRQQEEYERKKLEHEKLLRLAMEGKERRERDRLNELKNQKEEMNRKIREEEEARIAHAEEAQRQGNTDRIETILEKTTPIVSILEPIISPNESIRPILPPPPLPPPPPIPVPVIAKRPDDNVLSRDNWQYECFDLFALAKAIIEGRAPIEYLVFNKPEIGKDVRRLKDQFRCDGVRTWKERTTTFRATGGE